MNNYLLFRDLDDCSTKMPQSQEYEKGAEVRDF